MSAARQELIRLQKRMYQHNQRLILGSVSVTEPGFQAYERRYRRAVSKYQRVMSVPRMLKKIQRANLLFFGDYHTCAQSQRSFLRTIRRLFESGTPVVLGLELIHSKYQRSIDRFLAGEINETQFVRATRLKEHWVFDLWHHFAPILEYARAQGIPVYGIDAAAPGADLTTRDEATAECVATLCEQYADHTICTLTGDLHIAPGHLPKQVKRLLKARKLNRRELILYQNSEAIYWKLAEAGRSHDVNAVEIASNAICRMHTPPIVCQQSYLNWLQHEGEEIDYADANEQFIELLVQIAKVLHLQLPKGAEDIAVYTCGDVSFLQELKRKKLFTPEGLQAVREHVLSSESYIIPQARMVYLAFLSLNHAGEEASHYLKYLCAGPESPRDLKDAYFANIMHEALGFFGSKLINHRRKCPHPKNFEDMLDAFAGQSVEGHEQEIFVAHCILGWHNDMKRRKRTAPDSHPLYNLPHHLFMPVTHAIGYALGDRLFYGFMKGVVSKAHLQQLFQDPWAAAGDAERAYMESVTLTRGVRISQRL